MLEIDYLTNEESPHLPWTFRMPFKGQKKKNQEPIKHHVDLKRLTKVCFGTPNTSRSDEFTAFFRNEAKIVFEDSDTCHLTLEFDNKVNQISKQFESLPLTIKY